MRRSLKSIAIAGIAAFAAATTAMAAEVTLKSDGYIVQDFGVGQIGTSIDFNLKQVFIGIGEQALEVALVPIDSGVGSDMMYFGLNVALDIDDYGTLGIANQVARIDTGGLPATFDPWPSLTALGANTGGVPAKPDPLPDIMGAKSILVSMIPAPAGSIADWKYHPATG